MPGSTLFQHNELQDDAIWFIERALDYLNWLLNRSLKTHNSIINILRMVYSGYIALNTQYANK